MVQQVIPKNWLYWFARCNRLYRKTGYTGYNEPEITEQLISTPRTRTLSLECCGLIIHFDIGVAELSPNQAKEYVAQFIADNTDQYEISKCVKFYKEYFTTNSNTNKIEIKTILI